MSDIEVISEKLDKFMSETAYQKEQDATDYRKMTGIVYR
jgi:hypothetical protein